ncbi:MAG: hypothetical protein RLZZ182_2688 [Pseudomonadota bacterium]|jgi:hypothetical protein
MSASTLNRRIAAMEQRKAPPDGPQVIRLVFMKPKGEPSTDEDFRLAFIVG